MGEVRWSEELNGWLSKSQTDFNQAMLEGQRDKQFARLSLKLAVRDIAGFIAAEPPRAEVTEGELSGSGIGDQLRVTWGEFDLLAPSTELIDHLHLRMRYRLNLHGLGGDFRLRGFKLVENDPGYDSWSDTSTLFFRLYEHSSWPTEGSSPEQERRQMEEAWEEAPEFEPGLWASGVMQISPRGFAREVRSFFNGIKGGRYTGLADVLRYGVFFGEGLLKAYTGAPIPDGRPSFPVDRPRAPWDPEPAGPNPPPAQSGGAAAQGADPAGRWAPIPERREESEDRFALERELVHFEVDDLSFPLNLHHIRRRGEEAHGEPVLLIPGSGVRAQLWYGQPVGQTLVDYLLGEGKDVWVESWRASIDLPTNSYTLDQAARLDHPAAIAKVLEATGQRTLKVVSHCQGSISFVMAAVAGFLPEGVVTHAVSSGISLFFVIPDATWRKQRMMLPILNLIGTGGDAQCGIRPQTPAGSFLTKVSRSRKEYPCGNAPCQISNYMYGSGWDVLLRHKNLDDEIHAWTARELGYTPFTLITQVSDSCRFGHIVPAKDAHSLTPPSYVAAEPRSGDTRFTFIGGDHNWMFEVEGQKKTWEFFNKFDLPADFVVLPGYGHLDTWWGENSPSDVFPIVRDALAWKAGQPPPSAAAGRTQKITRPRKRGMFRGAQQDPEVRRFSAPPGRGPR